MERITWGYPCKSLEKAKATLKEDLEFYGKGGAGDCAKLDERNPRIVEKRRRDGSVWYYTTVDDIPLELAANPL